jgi:hypothetical protein
MAINYDKIQNAIKALGTVTDNDTFLKGFLMAFGFPNTTYIRLKAVTQNDVNQGVHIHGNGGVFFLASTATNLNSEFNILKKNNLNKIKEAFIIIVNENDVLAYERESGEVLETSKMVLYRNIEFFFPLLGIKADVVSDEMRSADIKASEKFAELYNELYIHNQNRSNDIARYLCRLLFCSFADSIGVLTRGGIRQLVANYTDISGTDTSLFFCNLFDALKKKTRKDLPGYFSNVKYMDSRLFEKSLSLLVFSRNARNLVLDLLGLNWSDISPDILGALIQSIIRKKASSSCSNYTSTANVQKVIGPLFMNQLYRSFERVKDSREGCETLLKRVKAISVFDPSSGTGNFLLVAYKELNKLAGKISKVIDSHIMPATVAFSSSLLKVAVKPVPYSDWTFVSWSKFHGIEEDEFSCAIARLGFLFVVCQEARDNVDVKRVFADTINVLFSDNIVNGNATKIDWETVCNGEGETYLIGNPSYVGARKRTPAQKTDLARVFKGYSKISNLDYAACWFLLATKFICAHGGGFAFVTTNSLTQGEQVQLLWPKLFENGVHIRFAYTSFKWKNDARNKTSVTVVVIGVVQNSEQQSCELFTPTTTLEPRSISPYLVPGNVIVNGRSTPLSQLPEMLKGNMPYDGGNLLLNDHEKTTIISNDLRAKKFIKKLIGAKEFIQGINRWCIWVRDTDYDEAMSIPVIKARIEKVRALRLANKDASVRKIAERPHQFREMRKTQKQSLIVPAVSSENYLYIPIGFVKKDTIVTNLASIIYDCESWIFGVVSSRMHNIWVMTVCGKHDMRPRYSLELGYNTFPFPDIKQEQKDIIHNCVLGVINAREQFAPKTLAQLYKTRKMPDDLKAAHSLLDKVIENCYRSTPFVSDQERLECLFELYNILGEQSI